jgi:hypothetical protein
MNNKTYPHIQCRQKHQQESCVCCSLKTADRASVEMSSSPSDYQIIFVCRGHSDSEVLAAVKGAAV